MNKLKTYLNIRMCHFFNKTGLCTYKEACSTDEFGKLDIRKGNRLFGIGIASLYYYGYGEDDFASVTEFRYRTICGVCRFLGEHTYVLTD